MSLLRRLLSGRPDSLGERGERHAARWLRRRGYRILERNLRIGSDEADLVALAPDEKTIVIVEVKTRSSDQITPETSVDHRKQAILARLASRLLKQPRYRDRAIRFDAIAVVYPATGKPIVRHHEGAFESPF